MKKRNFCIFLAVLILAISILACGSSAQPAAVPTPTPIAVQQGANVTQQADTGPKYGTSQLYDEAKSIAANIIGGGVDGKATLLGISILLLIILVVGIWFGVSSEGGWAIIVVISLIAGLGGSFYVESGKQSAIDKLGDPIANKAINDGVAFAQKAQATNYQYIYAPVVQEGIDTITCHETTSPDTTSGYGPSDDCAVNSSYYTHTKVDQWTETIHHHSCSTDSNGHESCTDWDTYEDHWKDRYTPWFDHIERTYIIPATKARYLSEQIYGQLYGERCQADDGSFVSCTHDDTGLINDSRKPVIYASADWRAPQNPLSHLYAGVAAPNPAFYNSHVPDAYSIPRARAQAGGPVYVETFIGPYFNYGLASEDVEFATYTGHYQDLVNIMSLPGPNGVTFSINDAFGKPMDLHTLLTGTDSDLPVVYNPVHLIGVKLDPSLLTQITETAMLFQGDFGPNPTKHGAAVWFLVGKSVVDQLGGTENTTSALKAYLHDSNVWGLFALPKNLVILVTEVSDDGKFILARDMDTGMPMGNVLVKQDMRLSIPSGTSLPLTIDNLIGTFTANYDPTQGDTFKYQYTDLSTAGGAASILYAPSDYKAPDPNSTDCVNASADHHGFILYSMCALQYKQSDIKINQKGHDLIMAGVPDSAKKALSQTGYWIFLVVVIVLYLITGAVKSGVFE